MHHQNYYVNTQNIPILHHFRKAFKQIVNPAESVCQNTACKNLDAICDAIRNANFVDQFFRHLVAHRI
jgi:hypothetical protein